MTKSDVDLSKDARFNFNPAPIQTAQDAAQAYLRKEITEDEFRSAAAKYGVVEPWTLFVGVDTAAYDQKVPDDLLKPPAQPDDTVQKRIEAAENTVEENEKLPPATELSTKSVK